MSQILAAAPHHSSFRSQELTHRKRKQAANSEFKKRSISGSWFVEAKEAEPELPSGNER